MSGQREYSQQELWDAAIEEHNKYRRMHGVPDVKGNQEMHADSQRWVDELIRTHKFEPTTMGKYGNNIASSLKLDKLEAIRDVMKTWYEKGKFYNYVGEGYDADDKKTGSFTAIVWKATTDIGVGVGWNVNDNQFIINIFYNNATGKHGENVLPPK